MCQTIIIIIVWHITIFDKITNNVTNFNYKKNFIRPDNDFKSNIWLISCH